MSFESVTPVAPELTLDESPLRLSQVRDFALRSGPRGRIELSEGTRARVEAARAKLSRLLEAGIPIYGVTTGFGDSCHRVVPPAKAEELQRNLIAYLSCGTGPLVPVEATRATLLIRLKSLSRGYSGVSVELLERMALFLERDWIPAVPREGSLGASGDLIPLAYLARALQGEGKLHDPASPGRTVPAASVLAEAQVAPYVLKAKEGLALVNGTSSMAGLCVVNLADAAHQARLAQVATAWLCLALQGKVEAFGALVNEKANRHAGQARAARRIRGLLEAEGYRPQRGQDVAVKNAQTQGFVQDRYSLRCAPQILGPVLETIDLGARWLETEINGTSDNPLVDDDGTLGMGGNFYGGYLSQAMDYLKVSLAQVADLTDRQLMMVMDERSSRGLPPNLADWGSIPEEDRFLHHGLKGLHQSVSAVTSEILARATPNSIFSRSSESHNQDKVSLGMSAAVRCAEMIEPLYTIQAMHLACLAQALDLRGVRLAGRESAALYAAVREHVPFVRRDASLGEGIQVLAGRLRAMAAEKREEELDEEA